MALRALRRLRLDHLQGVLHARAAGQRRALAAQLLQDGDMHVHLPGPAQGPGQPFQLLALALEPGIDAGLDQIQHRAHPPGGHPDFVQPVGVLLPTGH